MKAERNDFNVMLGDTIYSDSEVPGRLNPIALSVKQKWAKYRINLGNKNLQACAARPASTRTGTTTSS